MTSLWQDLRFGFRSLVKSPGFAFMAVLTLAIGIGANTAIFTVLNAVLLRPLPFHDPGRVMIVSENSPQFNDMSVAYPNYVDWRAQNSSFAQMALFRGDDYTLTDQRGPEHIDGREVSAGFFSLLGVAPILGRDFRPEEDQVGAAPVVIMSYGLWQRRFGGDRNILGRSIHLNDADYTVVGVLPRDFWFYSQRDVFVPIAATGRMWLKNRMDREGARAIGRLKPGVGLEQARADLNTIAKRLAAAYPEPNANHGVTIIPIANDVVSDVRGTLLLLFGAVALLLLIACVNVANLLLSRVVPRQRELAIRTALGASRMRIASQLLTESVLLALLGGILGIGLAWAGTRGLLAAVPHTLPRAQSIGVDWRVALFLLATCVITGILFGLAPVWQSLRGNTNETLKESGRGTVAGRHRLQSVLVISELALALVLLVCAGLTIRTLNKLGRVDPGFIADNVTTFSLGFSRLHYDTPEKIRTLFKNVVEKMEGVPGIQAAALTTDVMMRDDSEVMFYVSERPKPDPKDYSWSMMYITSPDYLGTMGVRLLRGRYFTEHDTLSSQNVLVVDEELARTAFPHQEALGQHLVMPFPGFEQPREIIGVVQHVKHWGLAQDSTATIRSEFYVPFLQIPEKFYPMVNGMTFAARSHLGPQATANAVAERLHEIDTDIPVYNVETMDEIISTSIARQRFATLLFVVFAIAALLLGAIGTYGVLSYSVSQRTHEMGVRMALGASARDVLRLVMLRGTKLIAVGALAGIVGALIFSRLLASLLYGVSSYDPATFGLVAAVLVTVAVAACYIPARRATKVDPMIALRYE
ncbi:MAG TPA: ABC transporter permease [Terriglobales bacterium]|nr:ABC transporter permease [Terriglobales bacterium]